MFILLQIVLSLVATASAEINGPELTQAFIEELHSPHGVQVEVHGADHSNGLYVISYRPKNFFEFVNISMQADYMSPQFADIKKQLATLRRHDFLLIKGGTNPFVSSPQNHVLVNELTILQKFNLPMTNVPEYSHTTKLLKDISDKTELIVKVHASLLDGQIFVVEFGDSNIPVVVKNPALTKDLYRGDKIKIRFQIQEVPTAPVHLVLDQNSNGIEMIDRIVDQHNQLQDRCGELVMFPQSPQVKFNVFAIKVDIGDNLFRLYTLINFDDMNLFLQIRDKAQMAWDSQTETVIPGRNYYINPKLRACAKGLGNMVTPTQANPQILINSIDDLKITSTL